MRPRAATLALCVATLALAVGTSGAQQYRVRKMKPTPVEKLQDIGSSEGMPLFPSEPVPGYPAMDPDIPGREPRNTPMYLPYEGSQELYHRSAGYHPKILPYNHRTLVKNWRAVDIPGVPARDKERFAQNELWLKPGAGWWSDYVPTGNRWAPQPVVRLKPAGERLTLDVGPLETSMYAVRVIAAVASDDVKPYPDNLVIQCLINDRPDGKISRYVLRQRAMDAFFQVGLFYFHVVDDRPHRIEISLHADSEVDLLVHNVDLHDVLGECAKRAGKTASILAPDHLLRSYWKTDPAEKLKPAKTGDWLALYPEPRRRNLTKDLRAEFPDADDAALLAEWRKRRDDAIWRSGTPLNVNALGLWAGLPIKVPANYSKVDPTTEKMMVAKGLLPEGYKKSDDVPWTKLPLGYVLPRDIGPWRLVDPKTKQVVYTFEDLVAGKPYPGLPWNVPPWGRRFASDIPGDPKFGEDGFKKSFYLSPQAQAVGQGVFAPYGSTRSYIQRGDMQGARDAAIKLVRWAYHLPNLQPGRYFSRVVGASVRSHLRWRRFYQYLDAQYIDMYDQLFSFIQGNRELADAVHRYIPWVETPEDVVTLLDTYQVQYLAQQMAYWRQNWYGHGSSARMAKVAAIQMDPEITTPWVRSIFTNTHEYPFPMAGIQDLMYMAIQRDGTTNIGSSYYTFGASVETARWLREYIRNGGDATYDLADAQRYPRVAAGLYWMLDGWVAGGHHMGIGDVGGFYRRIAEWIPHKVKRSGAPFDAWRWTGDPRFAWLAKHFAGRGDAPEAQWQALLEAAKDVRHPYMSATSRVLADWGAVLEGGRQSDDFRFRHALRLRVGYGTGHAHPDSLDLAMWSLGVPLNICAGARGGYAYPGIHTAASHNVVSIDGRNWNGYTWAPQLADMGRCQYASAKGLHDELFARQAALIELDEGVPSRTPADAPSLWPALYTEKGAGPKFDPNVTLPRAYAFDVFRVRGGKAHTLNLHGFPHDTFTTNVQPGDLTDAEQAFLKQYTLRREGAHWGGRVPDDHLVATWRLNREVREFKCTERPDRTYIAHQPHARKYAAGAEQWMLGSAYDPSAPRRNLRVHVLGQKDARMLTGEAIIAPYGVGRTDGEFHRQVHVTPVPQAGAIAEDLFVTLWEPYSGEPTIKAARMEGDPHDAEGFAAVHVETVTGQNDLCFADGPAKRLRTLEDSTQIEADFAYVSRDANGLRRADIVAGRLLKLADVTLIPDAMAHEARVVSVDHPRQQAVLDRALPAGVLDGATFEVGSPARGRHAAHWTTFQAESVEGAEENTCRVAWRKGSDVFCSVVSALPKKKNFYAWNPDLIQTDLAPPVKHGEHSQLMLTVDGKDTLWRCDLEVRDNYKGVNARDGLITLYGAPFRTRAKGADGKVVETTAINPGDRIRIWAFGPGDIWRTPTKLSLVRQADGTLAVRGNVGGTIRAAGAMTWSADGTTWHPLPPDGLHVRAETAHAGTVRLKRAVNAAAE